MSGDAPNPYGASVDCKAWLGIAEGMFDDSWQHVTDPCDLRHFSMFMFSLYN
jgi:hypothetical protein